MSAKLYYNLTDYKASIVALNNCLIDFPESKYREEIMFLVLKSKYFLALKQHSVKANRTFSGHAWMNIIHSLLNFPKVRTKKMLKICIKNLQNILRIQIQKQLRIDGTKLRL